ncbi:DNA-directed RNA polymerase subunit H [Candidatus Woesearchaeota archaeon]|nr:DNA-directed RNA polymerase subunit H [Candidatus Woesearchaeota archaeon]
MASDKKTEPINHFLVPKHEKLSKDESGKVLENLHIDFDMLPKIIKDDPAIKHLDAKQGDIIKITRNSQTSGEAVFYRGVTE